MQRKTKFIWLAGLSVVFFILALIGGGFAVHLVRIGAYPSSGAGSLGHVGAVVAGLIAGFMAIILVLLSIYAWLRARAVRGAQAGRAGAALKKR